MIFNSLIISFSVYTLQYCSFYDFKNLLVEKKYNVKELSIVKYKQQLYVNINNKDQKLFFPLGINSKKKVNNILSKHMDLNIEEIVEINNSLKDNFLIVKEPFEIPIIKSIQIDVKVDLSYTSPFGKITQITDILATYICEDVSNKTFRLLIDSNNKIKYKNISNNIEALLNLPDWSPIFFENFENNKNLFHNSFIINNAEIIGDILIIKLKYS